MRREALGIMEGLVLGLRMLRADDSHQNPKQRRDQYRRRESATLECGGMTRLWLRARYLQTWTPFRRRIERSGAGRESGVMPPQSKAGGPCFHVGNTLACLDAGKAFPVIERP